MEVPLARYQNILLSKIQNACSFPFSLPFSDQCVFKPESLLSGYGFSFAGRGWMKNKLAKARCSQLGQELKPRPKLQPSRIESEEEDKERRIDEACLRKSSWRVCCQIEKLVLCNRHAEALELFEILAMEGCFVVGPSTYDSLITACIFLRSIRGVKRLCSYMIENGFEPDLYMRNRMLIMHVKCGMMIDARRLFDEMTERNLVSWNTIITGLIDAGECAEAFRLFAAMYKDFSDCGPRIFSSMIRASSGLGSLAAGRQFHACAVKNDADDDYFVSCALIDMYSKCGSIDDAQRVFDLAAERTTVTWNSIITGYAFHGYSEEALCKVIEMCDSGVSLDHFTFSIIVRVCTRLGLLEHGKQAHAGLIRHGFGFDTVANTALVDFYSKWGGVESARNVFEHMPNKNLISWNALIAGYGNHGKGSEAVALFDRLVKEGVTPNHVTFLAVLSACSYSGLFESGWEIFRSMDREHNVKPRAMHLACMVELLGREALLDEAFAMIRNAPFRPTANMWAALLTACRVHGNLELGKLAAEKLYGMGPEKLRNYVTMFNIYNESGRPGDAEAVLWTLNEKGLRMVPACSWVNFKNGSYVFLSGDQSHARTREIYDKVDELMREISDMGYVPEGKTLLSDVDESEERVRLYHSEKLAVAFGLLSTPVWAPLQIVQSHRVCNDCHRALKMIALVSGREIVVRDASRFHRLRDGECSCGDFW